MAPKKKAPTNGYFYLLMELRNKMDMKRANEEASRLWPIMTPSEKEPYNQRAKCARSTAVKMTAVNENMDLVAKNEQDIKERELNMQDDIKSHVRFLRESNTLTEEYFHIMHVNNYFSTSEGVHYPGEIGLVRYNFKDGVLDKNVYHTRIYPGKFPLGYAATAKISSDTTHKLPYFMTGENNMEAVTKDVFAFLHESKNLCNNPTRLPAIYVKDDFKKIVTGVLTQMSETYGFDPDELRIYNLSYLLFTLRNDITNSVAWPSISNSINELDRDIYDYTPEIPCEFHKYERDCPVHCSRSHVIRMAYVLCDNCCQDMGVKLIAGRHVPMNSVSERLRDDPPANGVSVNGAGAFALEDVRSESGFSQSYRSNVQTLDFDDCSTVNNDSELQWTDVVSNRSARREPKTDWRATNFGRGRGRGIANRKANSGL